MISRLTFTLTLIAITVACAPLAVPETSAPTATPAAIERAAPTNTLTHTETLTPDFAATLIALQRPTLLESFVAPNGRWWAEAVRYECARLPHVDPNLYGADGLALEQLKIVNVDDGSEKVVTQQLLNCGGLGAFGFGGRAWSLNSRYFYFTDTREGVPDGGVCHWNRTLLRVKVESGAVENLLPGVISPDKTLIAMPDGNELVLWGADNGEVTRLPGPAEGVVAQAAWSPDGESLIYLHTQSKCMPYDKATVVRIAWPSLEQTVLLESETPSFRALAFGVLNEIELTAEDGQLWRFDLITRELKPAVNGQ
ncbi:MAG: hypothetical protein ACT4QE_19520 [Anaerolineales bacterium]